MKNLKTFEELNPETYYNAAKKLDRKGHTKRANDLVNWGNIMKTKQLEDLPKFTITSYRRGQKSGYVSDRELEYSLTGVEVKSEPIPSKKSIWDRIKGVDEKLYHFAIVKFQNDEGYTREYYYPISKKIDKTKLRHLSWDDDNSEEYYNFISKSGLNGLTYPGHELNLKNREEAKRFIDIVNNEIKDYVSENNIKNPSFLNINDFYREL